ncbi:MAG TPA: hypothetical protein VKB08_12375 [Bradyrhizobium sp.]|nr:hypothetical protein [Bradyrhizobium sp.]
MAAFTAADFITAAFAAADFIAAVDSIVVLDQGSLWALSAWA